MSEQYNWTMLAAQIDARYIGKEGIPYQGISHDTRTLQSGQAYLAIRGQRVDGHDYILEAIAKGAALVIVENAQPNLSVPQIIVPDTLSALAALATVWRAYFDIPIVGITGSVGKTTTKQLTAQIFQYVMSTLASQGNWNNHIGLPLNLLRLTSTHQAGIFEVGASGPGEISRLAAILKPTLAAVTAVAPAHVKGFGSIDGVAHEKSQLLNGLTEGGIAIAPLDNYVAAWKKATGNRKLFFCGMTDAADYYATDVRLDPQQIHFQAHTPMGEAPFTIPLAGQHNVMNSLFAIALATQSGIPLSICQRALSDTMPVKGRLNFHRLKENITLIDDSYNANPTSVKAALAVLANQPGSRKIFVFGDMAELDASLEVKEHEAIGQEAKNLKIDAVYSYGDLAKHAAIRFGQPNHVFHSHAAILDALSLKPGDVCLIKGSRCNELDKVVNTLMHTQGTES